MKLALRFARPFRVWHARLRARLEAAGHHVSLLPTAATPGRTLPLALAVERAVYRSRPVLFAVRPEPDLEDGEMSFDCVLSLDETQADDADLSILFDGRSGQPAMLDALLAGRAPRVSIVDRAGRSRASGRPAIERPDRLSRSLDHGLAAVVDLVVTAVEATAAGTSAPHSPDEPPPAEPPRAGRPLVFVARHLAHKIARRLAKGAGGEVHWQIATRRLGAADPDVTALRAWPDAAFATLRDDGSFYLADPFPFEHAGSRYLFAELFPYATRRGVIALMEIDAHGAASSPRVVLEQPGHLSYPFVFEAEGGIYMLPETSDAKCLRLFRSDPFPDRWVPDCILVDDIVAADATPVFHDGLYWIFAAVSGDGGSSWDRLGLFHAPSLLGPWTAHRANPVLVDSGAARPAGALWHEDGILMRVAQDCRAGYGAGLAICRVDRLDRDGYAQTVVATLAAPRGTVCAHTVNRSCSIEVIDIGRVDRSDSWWRKSKALYP